jgi:hypothetical protein
VNSRSTASPIAAGGLPACRPRIWHLLALVIALVWCGGAKPPPKSDAPPPTGIPYEGIDAKEMKALVGKTVDLIPLKGKTIKNVELVKLTPGKQPGVLQSIAFKSEGGPTRNLRAATVARLVAGTRFYDVIADRQKKGAFLLVDIERRDALVNVRLEKKGGYSLWPVLTADEQDKALDENKEFLKKIDNAIPNRKFQLHETSYYLFYTDIPEGDVAPIIANLDSMYLTLGQKFGVYEGTNIWHGKAMIVVFSTKDLFARFEKIVMEIPDVGDSQGFYHPSYNGDVLTACAVGDDAAFFVSVLIHDTARSYMFRYRSNVYLPAWVSEGIAEWVTASVLPNNRFSRGRQEKAAETARSIGSLDGFFDVKNLKSWQYGVAASVADILIKTDAQAYRALIQGIKEGQTWEESLQDSYGLSSADLIQLYANQIGVPSLRP